MKQAVARGGHCHSIETLCESFTRNISQQAGYVARQTLPTAYINAAAGVIRRRAGPVISPRLWLRKELLTGRWRSARLTMYPI